MKLLLVILFWLSVLAAYGGYRFVKRDRPKFESWMDGFLDWWSGIDNERNDKIGYYRSGQRRAAEVRYYLGWVGYGLLCFAFFYSLMWANKP